jgi:hypothetical protein
MNYLVTNNNECIVIVENARAPRTITLRALVDASARIRRRFALASPA